MKTFVTKFTILLAITFSLNACSTPEERAIIVGGSDSTTATTSTPDSLGADSNNMGNNSGPGGASKPDDSTIPNQKMESFRHTPIDTITSLQDSTNK